MRGFELKEVEVFELTTKYLKDHLLFLCQLSRSVGLSAQVNVLIETGVRPPRPLVLQGSSVVGTPTLLWETQTRQEIRL